MSSSNFPIFNDLRAIFLHRSQADMEARARSFLGLHGDIQLRRGRKIPERARSRAAVGHLERPAPNVLIMSATFEPRLDILPESQLRLWPELNPLTQTPWVHHKPDNLEAFVDRGGLVKVAFFGGLDTLQRVENPKRAVGSRVRICFADRFGRYEDEGDSGSRQLEGLRGHSSSRVEWNRSGDGTLDQVSESMRRDLTRWAQEIDPGKLPPLRSQHGLSPGGMEL